MPAEDFVQLVDAPTAPSLSLDPSERWLLLMQQPELRTIAELCREERGLAGLRLDPKRLLPALASGYTQLTLQLLGGGPLVPVEGLPAGSRVRSVTWRPGGGGFAFVLLPPGDSDECDTPQLWLAEFDTFGPPPSSVRAERLLDAGGRPLRLNGVLSSPLQWHPDGKRLLLTAAVEVPEPPAVAVKVPAGPAVQVSSPGKKSPARTYQDLLGSVEDEADYERFTTVQLLVYDVAARKAQELGPPDMYRATIFSPDGAFLLVSMTRRPFSYLVPHGRFARDIEVWSLPSEGTEREVWPVASLPARDQIPTPRDAVENMPRDFTWCADCPHALRFTQALDGGDPRNKADENGFRDQLFTITGPPFDVDGRVPGPRLEMRYSGFRTCKDGTRLLSEWRWKDRRMRTWVLPPSGNGAGDRDAADGRWLLFDRFFEDTYTSPGSFVTKVDEVTQKTFLRQRATDGALVLFGDGASPRGRRPFVDTLRLEEAQALVANKGGSALAPFEGTERLWRCVAGPSKPGDPEEKPELEVGGAIVEEAARREEFEQPAALLGGGPGEPMRLLFWREAQDRPPNLFIRSLDNPAEAEVPVTDFPHPQPSLRSVRKRLVKYRRADGVELNADLYLPPGYDAERDGRLPCLMWAYPREYKSTDAAGQIRSSPFSFVRGSWSRPLFWVLRGYAVLDDPKMPVVGEGNAEPNDSFVKQLCMGAEAAVDCVVKELGVADPDRICVGGHSYGAFMTAHLLAHTELFRAGICRSGAYNRSLTPFGFQSEDRSYWEATETYTTMSPFLYAKQLGEKGAPLLLIHGEDDPNPGTLKMQSERFFQALKGHGATARLVLLPKERHGYSARESILHALYEQDQWMQVHNAPRPEAAVAQKPAAEAAEKH